MIWLCIVLYPIIGFAFLLIGQILNHRGFDSFYFYEPDDDVIAFRFMAMITVLCWPIFAIFYMIILFIPWLFWSGYKLFVGMIFGTIALFKKEKGKDGLE